MKRLLVIALVAASVAVPSAGAAQFSTRTLSDVHVGRSKTELIAQRDFSQRKIDFIDHHHWMIAARHRTCWSHVPWSRTCNRARQIYRAHRWLHDKAQSLYEALFVPHLPPGACGSCWDAVARCESHDNWSEVTGNGFYWGLQWLPSTWDARASLLGLPTWSEFVASGSAPSREMQITAATGMSLSNWPVCGANY